MSHRKPPLASKVDTSNMRSVSDPDLNRRLNKLLSFVLEKPEALQPDAPTRKGPPKKLPPLALAAPGKSRPAPARERSPPPPASKPAVPAKTRRLPKLQEESLSERSSSAPGFCSHSPQSKHTRELRIHSHFCPLCAEQEKNAQRSTFQRFFEREQSHRSEVENASMVDVSRLRDDYFLFIQECRSAVQRELRRSEAALRYEAKLQRQRDEEGYLEKRSRKLVVQDWEADWGELLCFERTSRRHIQQLEEMHTKQAIKLRREEEERKRQEHDESVTKVQEAAAKVREGGEAEETEWRKYIENGEETIRNAMTDVFLQHRQSIRQQELRVQEMMSKHLARVSVIEAEVDRLYQDEASARERNVLLWRRVLEGQMSMEPELRKRANVAANSRLKREQNDRMMIEYREEVDRKDAVEKEDKAWDELWEQVVASWEIVLTIERRRDVIRGRRAWRMDQEAAAREIMLVEDNAVWRVYRQAFEDALVYDAAAEEVQARSVLHTMEEDARHFVMAHERARARTQQLEVRTRSVLLREQLNTSKIMMEDFLKIPDLFTLQWQQARDLSAIRREYETDVAYLDAYFNGSHDCATTMSRMSRSKPETVFSAPDCQYSLSVRQTQLHWFFGCAPCSLLDSAALKISAGGTKMLDNVEGLSLMCSVLNPRPGDVLQVPPEGMKDMEWQGESAFTATYTGTVGVLFECLRFENKEPYQGDRVFPRVISITLDGSLFVTLYVNVYKPLICIPKLPVRKSLMKPLKYFEQPSVTKFKKVRIALWLPKDSVNTISVVPPDEYSYHHKSGIMKDGRVIMRVMNSSSKEKLELEFENNADFPRILFQSINVVRAYDGCPLDPLSVMTTLTQRDDNVLFCSQSLELDAPMTDVTTIYIPSKEITVRSLCSGDCPERMLEAVPWNFQPILPASVITLPKDQADVIGGCMTFCLSDTARTEGTEGREGILGIQQRDGDISFFVDDNTNHSLMLTTKGTESEYIGKITGFHTNFMRIDFASSVAIMQETVQELLRCITFCAPIKPGMSTKASCKWNLDVFADLNADVSLDPLSFDARITAVAPLLEAPAKALTMNYKESSGFCRISTQLEAKLGTLRVSADALICVEVTAGQEYIDEFDVIGKEFDPETNLFCFKHKGVPMAWWANSEIESGASKSPLVIHLSGTLGIQPWMRTDIEERYTPASVKEESGGNFEQVSTSSVTNLLRAISFCVDSNDPQELKKTIVITLDDGRYGRSRLSIAVDVETVDDPTEIHLQAPELTYRQNTAAALEGFQLFPRTTISDPDTYNFHGGYIIVEHMTSGGETGDTLNILTREQQEERIYEPEGSTSSVSMLSRLLEQNRGAPLSFLEVLVQEQPVRAVKIVDGKLMYEGQQMGTVIWKTNGFRDAPPIFLRVNFASESGEVSFAFVSFFIQCVTFENTSPKIKPGPRNYSLRVSATGDKAGESQEKVTVVAHPAIIFCPAFALNMKYEDGNGVRPLFRQGVGFLAQPLVNSGFFRCDIEGCRDANDELLLEGQDVKVTDQKDSEAKLVAVSGNVVGTLTRKSQQDFTIAFSKVATNDVTAILRAVCFSNSGPSRSGERYITALCSPDKEEEASKCQLTLNVISKGTPTEIKFKHSSLTFMTGSSALPIAHGVTVIDHNHDIFPNGTVLEIALAQRKVLGEALCFMKTDEVDPVLVGTSGVELRHYGVLCGKCMKSAAKVQGGVVMLSKPIVLDLKDTSAEMLQCILESVGYYNKAKENRGASKKGVSFTLRVPMMPIVRTQVNITIAPMLLDFGGAPSLSQAAVGQALPIAPSCKIQLAASAAFCEISATFLYGNEDEDKFVLKPCTPDAGIAREGSSFYSPSDRRKTVVAKVVTSGDGEPLSVRSEAPSSSMMQTILKCFQVEFAATETSREVSIQLSATCNYGQAREVIRMRV